MQLRIGMLDVLYFLHMLFSLFRMVCKEVVVIISILSIVDLPHEINVFGWPGQVVKLLNFVMVEKLFV